VNRGECIWNLGGAVEEKNLEPCRSLLLTGRIIVSGGGRIFLFASPYADESSPPGCGVCNEMRLENPQ
jgi:hypothetical protein